MSSLPPGFWNYEQEWHCTLRHEELNVAQAKALARFVIPRHLAGETPVLNEVRESPPLCKEPDAYRAQIKREMSNCVRENHAPHSAMPSKMFIWRSRELKLLRRLQSLPRLLRGE
jgi:hypothetical protein